MMAHYPDVFIMTFSIHIPNFALLSHSSQLLLIFCYAAALYVVLGLSIHHLKQGEADIPNSRVIHTLKMKLQEIMRGESICACHVHSYTVSSYVLSSKNQVMKFYIINKMLQGFEASIVCIISNPKVHLN